MEFGTDWRYTCCYLAFVRTIPFLIRKELLLENFMNFRAPPSPYTHAIHPFHVWTGKVCPEGKKYLSHPSRISSHQSINVDLWKRITCSIASLLYTFSTYIDWAKRANANEMIEKIILSSKKWKIIQIPLGKSKD